MTEVLQNDSGAQFEQNRSTEYYIFHNRETVQYGARLRAWPLHMTIVPSFRLERSDSEQAIIELLRDIAEDFQPFIVAPGERALYGENSDREVTRIHDVTGNLQALHERFVWDLGSLGCDHFDGRWALNRFSPHVSDQDGRQLDSGPFLVDSLALARKADGTKSFAGTIGLVY